MRGSSVLLHICLHVIPKGEMWIEKENMKYKNIVLVVFPRVESKR